MTQEDVRPSSNTPDGLLSSEPLMSAPDESSDATEAESTTTSSTSWNRALSQIDLESLSPRSQAIMLNIGDEMLDGYTLTTLANELKRTSSWVSDRLNELRNEILLRANLFLPLTDTEFDALKDSIKENGVQVPVIIGEHTLIDGRHRWLIARELGLAEIPARFEFGRTKDEEHTLAVTINAARRHLNRKQKEDLVRYELALDWLRSSRMIASICGVSAPFVETIRDRMRREAEHEPAPDELAEVHAQAVEATKPVSSIYTPPPRTEDVRVSASGQTQKAYAEGRGPQPVVEEQIITDNRPMGYAVCAHGVRHAVYKDSDGLRLEAI